MKKYRGKVVQGRRIRVKTRLNARTGGNPTDAATSKLRNLFKSYTRCKVVLSQCTPAESEKRGSSESLIKLQMNKKLSNSGTDNKFTGVLLLSAINDMFRMEKVSKLTTRSILVNLYEDSYKRSAFYSNGKRIGARRLNTILQNEFRLHSCDIRFASGVFKGFHRNAITEAWRQVRKTPSLSNSSSK